MTVFKIGDLVRVITTKHGANQYNDIGIVVDILPNADFKYWVDFVYDDRCVNKQVCRRNTYTEDDLRLEFKPYDPNQEPEDDCI